MTGRDTDPAAPDGVELLPPPIRPQDLISSDIEMAAATRELKSSDRTGTAEGEAEFPESSSSADRARESASELAESQDGEEIAASVGDSTQADETASEESIETNSFETEESVEVGLDVETSGQRNSAEELEMHEPLTEDVASERAELDANTPDEVEGIEHDEHSLPEAEMTENQELATDEMSASEPGIGKTDTELESLENTEAEANATSDGEIPVVAEHHVIAEPEPPTEATSKSRTDESRTGEESQFEATAPESAPKEEPVQNPESDTRSETELDTQASTKPETELDQEAKTVAQVSTIVMTLAVIVLWLLLR